MPLLFFLCLVQFPTPDQEGGMLADMVTWFKDIKAICFFFFSNTVSPIKINASVKTIPLKFLLENDSKLNSNSLSF